MANSNIMQIVRVNVAAKIDYLLNGLVFAISTRCVFRKEENKLLRIILH